MKMHVSDNWVRDGESTPGELRLLVIVLNTPTCRRRS